MYSNEYFSPDVERDPCDDCGENAECIRDGDKAVCRCPPNYFGSPHLVCKPECIVNTDCPNYLACRNQQCKDPCVGACGVQALCDVVMHAAGCSCPIGYEGDPYIECKIRECYPLYSCFGVSKLIRSELGLRSVKMIWGSK